VQVIQLDAEESRWLLAYMHEQENLPPAKMRAKQLYLQHCAATGGYMESFGRFPDWEGRDHLYDNPSPWADS
jgi:hypothetical protein